MSLTGKICVAVSVLLVVGFLILTVVGDMHNPSVPLPTTCSHCIYECEQSISSKLNEAVCVDYCRVTACAVAVDASTDEVVP